MKNKRLLVPLYLGLFFSCGCVGNALGEQREVLLFGNTYGALLLKVDGRVEEVSTPSGFIGQGFASLPSLSSDGNLIAWGLALPDGLKSDATQPKVKAPMRKSVLGVYSVKDKSWKFYGDFCVNGVGSTTFSADGKRIAFFASESSNNANCQSFSFGLHILDLQSRSITVVPNTCRFMANARLTWSPDGRYLAGQLGTWMERTHQVVLIELATRTQNFLVEGENPSWSPSGEWIAYTTDLRGECAIVRPDGTEMHFVSKPSRDYRFYSAGATWSPDSERLMLNEGEEWDNYVVELALSSGKIVKTIRHSMLAFGWASTPSSSLVNDPGRP